MKVIIVEVTRAANSFGRTHLAKIREAYALIADIVGKAQADGSFRTAVTPTFAALAFYGAIEQVLTGWIFDTLPQGEAEFDEAKAFIVETICGGLDAGPGPRTHFRPSRLRGCQRCPRTKWPSASSGPACWPVSARSPRSPPARPPR